MYSLKWYSFRTETEHYNPYNIYTKNTVLTATRFSKNIDKQVLSLIEKCSTKHSEVQVEHIFDDFTVLIS